MQSVSVAVWPSIVSDSNKQFSAINLALATASCALVSISFVFSVVVSTLKKHSVHFVSPESVAASRTVDLKRFVVPFTKRFLHEMFLPLKSPCSVMSANFECVAVVEPSVFSVLPMIVVVSIVVFADVASSCNMLFLQ